MTSGRPTGRSCTSLISTYIGTHTSPMYIRSRSVTRKTTRGDLAASASPLGPGQPTCQAYRRRGSAASPARCCRCRACTRAGTAPSSSSARSTWAYVTRSSPRASRAAPAGSMGSLGDRRSSPCPRRPRARDFFHSVCAAGVDHSPTVRDGEHEVKGTEWGGRRACRLRSKHTK